MGGDGTAENRDQSAEARDQASEDRDERAAARDELAQVRDRVDGDVNSEAAADRAGALQDRRRAATDRTHAADDREAAAADRVRSAREQAAFSIDELTGAHRREAGLVELRREMVRAKRTKQPLALAFVDVDDLKGTNDSLGHAAGDRLLRETADCIRTYLRSYDLIIRFGGDEFLCALLDMNVAEATERFSLVSANLAATCQASVTVGLAELEADDALEDLIARADEAMYRERQQSRSAGA
jgi:diguanylate cyclase (GGDEF)-like protein